MSLYVVQSEPLVRRKTPCVFFSRDGKWFDYASRNESLVFDKVNPGFEDYLSLIKRAEEKKLREFEIRIDDSINENTEEFFGLIDCLTNYLLDKDVSVGLLMEYGSNESIIMERLAKLGISAYTTAPPRERVLNKDASGKDGAAPRKQFDGKMCFRLGSSGNYPFAGNMMFALGPSPIEIEETFHQKLLKHLIKSGKSNAEVYRKGGVSKQVFSKIISSPDMIPTKGTVICLALGLELSIKETSDLLESAGYALSRSIIVDVIISRHIDEKDFDLDSINMELNEHGCPILGWRPREE